MGKFLFLYILSKSILLTTCIPEIWILNFQESCLLTYFGICYCFFFSLEFFSWKHVMTSTILPNFWSRRNNGILLPKLFWPTVRKKCSTSHQEKLWKFEAESREFAKFLRSLERFFSNSEISVQFLKQNALTLFLEISQI